MEHAGRNIVILRECFERETACKALRWFCLPVNVQTFKSNLVTSLEFRQFAANHSSALALKSTTIYGVYRPP